MCLGTIHENVFATNYDIVEVSKVDLFTNNFLQDHVTNNNENSGWKARYVLSKTCKE